MSSQRLTSPRGNLKQFAHLGNSILFKLLYRPSTSEAEEIIKIIDAGMACARFNFSHGTAKVNNQKYIVINKYTD